MNILIGLFLIFISSVSLAQGNALPRGWVQMQTPDPIILSWVRVVEGKKMEESPTLMIQKHEYSLPWEKSLSQISEESDGCKRVAAIDKSDWNQLYCLRDKTIFAILWRGESDDMASTLNLAKNWLKENE